MSKRALRTTTKTPFIDRPKRKYPCPRCESSVKVLRRFPAKSVRGSHEEHVVGECEKCAARLWHHGSSDRASVNWFEDSEKDQQGCRC
jgi:hypothetical protein